MADAPGPLLPRRRFALSGVAFGATALMSGPSRAADAPAAPAAQTGGPVVLAGVSPRLTIHCLDTFHGVPADGMKVAFSKFDGKEYVPVKMITIGPNGRAVDDPVLVGDTYVPGRYEFLLHADDYFTKTKAQLPSVPFLHKVPVRFQVVNASQRIHLPIQFGPWSYTYSRGS